MSTHSSTQSLPGIGAPSAPRANLRAYLAGTGSTTALIAGLVILFLAAGAFVAFNGFPFGNDSPADGVTIGSGTAGAPEAAALALAAGPDAVAATPTALVGGPAAAVDGGAAFAAATAAGASGGPGTAPPGTGPGPTVVPPATGGGALTHTVGVVDDATSNLGPPLNLGRTTGPLTENLDRAVTDALNNVGGSNGPRLGDRVNETVNGLRDGVNRGVGGLGLGG